MALTAGLRLGSHEIISLIGAGGMGEVYLAMDTKLNRRVAIKVLPDAYASDAERVARFQREAQAVAALNHSGIAAIYDLAEAVLAIEGQAGLAGQAGQAGTAAAIRYLVLELVEGDTLADRVARGPMPVEDALAIAKQILEALEAAHEKGICHRDLKPANIKFATDGALKVLDFGLAKFLQSGPSAANLTHSPTLTLAATFPGVIMGTAGYMSPEQAKGFEADQRSDIFSFGCILYELLTGRRAFEGETVSEILASVLKSDVDFSALPPKLNPRLVELLRRCLEKNPKKRWHAAADVRIEIEALIGRGVVVEEPRAIEGQVRPPAARRAAIFATALVAAITAGVAAGYAAWRMKPDPPRTVTRFGISLPDGQTFTGAGRQMLALSPDGTNLVYVANQRLYLRGMSGLAPRAISGAEDVNLVNPMFSPDGKSLVYYAGTDRTLKRIDVSGGAPVTVYQAASSALGMSWTEPGSIVLAEGAKGIVRLSLPGGSAEVIVPAVAGETFASPQVLPGGRAVLFSVGHQGEPWDRGKIVVQPVGGARKIVVDGGADPRYLPTGHLVYALSGVLLAAPFDLATLTLSGGAVPVIEGVRRTATIVDGPGTAQFVYSQTGTLVYLPGPVGNLTDGFDIGIFDRKGQVQPLKLPPGTYAAPRGSPDGKRVAFERADAKEVSIWVYELSGARAPQRLTFGGNNRAPIWSPDGVWIAFQSDREGDAAIFRQRADGSGVAERVSKPDKGVAHTPQSWSKNGHILISVQKGEPTASTLFTMAERGGELTPFGDMPSREAVFSPDGRWVAYQTPNAVVRDTFVAPFPWTGVRYQVPKVNNGGGHPFWSAKGDQIIMNTGQISSTLVSVSTGQSVSFGPPQDFPRNGRNDPNPTTGRRNTDAMPDNEHFVGVVSPTAGVDQMQQMIVTLNWFDEVRQRAAR